MTGTPTGASLRDLFVAATAFDAAVIVSGAVWRAAFAAATLASSAATRSVSFAAGAAAGSAIASPAALALITP